ncbi:MAG: methylenetetrahydrofolate reductase [Thermoplasmata archaeon]|nr:methylenetetrahydrofolate reductase [Thermoplasmata archaeon]
MRRTLSEAIASRPLFFEPAPPRARAPSARAAEHRERVVRLLRSLPRVDAVDIPELVDENHDGKPFYRSGEVRDFAHHIEAESHCEAIVNKVVAHMQSHDELVAWARDTVARGIRHVVLVGGSSRYIPYPGPSVIEANRLAGPVFASAKGRVGNIAIPQRTGEAHRLLAKTRAGATFFTTQILFDSGSVLAMVREYDGLCRQAGIPPAAVVLSLAPVIDQADADFVRWLGADIPEEAEQALLSRDEDEGQRRSIEHSLELWETVQTTLRREGIEVPVGINVEEIMSRHLESAAGMIRAFAQAFERSAP